MKAFFEFISKFLAALSHAAGDKAEEPDTPAPEKVPTVDTVTGWTGEPPYRYIDVSRWQGTIDWEKVKATEYRGAMLRALGNKGGNPYFDPCFEKNYAGAKSAGLDVGVYWYSVATTQAGLDAELSMLKEAVRGKELTLPVAMDVEDSRLAVLNAQELTDHVATALHEVEQMGFYAQLYTYTSFAKAHLFVGGAALPPYDVWLADYTGKTPKVDFQYNSHQHTSKGRVPGISGNVDLNVTTLNYPKIIRKKGLTRLREAK
nr:MAG TPA: PlyB like endolysin [Caudoviricetes sp.]